MILRDYQKSQIDFIKSRIDVANIVGVESPTGSGKTLVFMEFIKHWMNKPENHLTNVVISTGFNNLVFLMEKRAKEIGLDPIILIGTRAANCPVMMQAAGVEEKIFTETDEYRCGEVHKHLDISKVSANKKTCPYSKDLYQRHFSAIKNNAGQLIITNHSSLLIHQQSLINTSLLIIDEAHTFSAFYDSYLKLELNKSDLMAIDNAICSISQPMQAIIKRNIGLGVTIPSVQIDKICENIEDPVLAEETKEFFSTKKSLGNYIETTPYQYTINKFYRSFELDIHPKIILFSATLDKFTLNMFNVGHSHIYKEFKTFCDYSKSEFIAIPNDDFKIALLKFLDYVAKDDLISGLCLSTTITDMKTTLTFDGYDGYKMFTEIDKFQAYNKGKKILVGSRALFQGIDIPDLDFVCLNKIPFPTYDDKQRAFQEYLTNGGKNGFDTWNQFTIPKTENDIIQSLGRLWRNPESKGIVSIFDSRIIDPKFKYIIRDTMDQYRHGIKINAMNDDGIVTPLKYK